MRQLVTAERHVSTVVDVLLKCSRKLSLWSCDASVNVATNNHILKEKTSFYVKQNMFIHCCFNRFAWYMLSTKVFHINLSEISVFGIHIKMHINKYAYSKLGLNVYQNNIYLWLFRCVKGVCTWSYSGPHFPLFGLNTERYSVSLHI